MADEVTDCSNIEQLSLVIRYHSGFYSEVREEFCGFVACTKGVTGQAIATIILQFVTKLGLDMSHCRYMLHM